MSNLNKSITENSAIVVVSGLPRSGTSMMMQMLAAGGMPIFKDHTRQTDENNPQGYFEHSSVKNIKTESGWISEVGTKAVKIISHLLTFLPETHHYKIIFMQRDLREIVESQNKMLSFYRKEDHFGAEKLIQNYSNHLLETGKWLEQQKNIQIIDVNYSAVIGDSAREAGRVNDFLGGRLDEKKMAAAVKETLYRNRR